MTIPGVSPESLCASLVRILPRTILVLDIVATPEEAFARARNESQADGSEHWYRCFTPADVAKSSDPVFAMGMVRHEFARAVRDGLSFPAMVPLDGGGTGFAIDRHGHVLTNYHLVTSEVGNFNREAGALDREARCRTLRAQIAVRVEGGGWAWIDAQEVCLVSNPPADRAIRTDEQGRSELREDTALLRVTPSPGEFLKLSRAQPAAGTAVWMAGFPLRSARSSACLASIGYSDADGTLRVSAGRVTATEPPDYFTTDLDGSMGNSGSPVFTQDGQVVGMFSRATGDGPRNAFEYGFVQRVHVTSDLAVRGMKLHERRSCWK
ncbi:MAG: serine protease [Betaproteobacteria bacterium]